MPAYNIVMDHGTCKIHWINLHCWIYIVLELPNLIGLYNHTVTVRTVINVLFLFLKGLKKHEPLVMDWEQGDIIQLLHAVAGSMVFCTTEGRNGNQEKAESAICTYQVCTWVAIFTPASNWGGYIPHKYVHLPGQTRDEATVVLKGRPLIPGGNPRESSTM